MSIDEILGLNYEPQHLKVLNYDAAKAKDFYLNKILEIFKDLQS